MGTLKIIVMAKKETKDSHFIPSPFKAVTEYENEIVKKWNENTAEAVINIVNKLAELTSLNNKNKKNEKNN